MFLQCLRFVMQNSITFILPRSPNRAPGIKKVVFTGVSDGESQSESHQVKDKNSNYLRV